MSDELIGQAGRSMPEYRVIATPWEGGYELDVVGIGSTRTRESDRDAVEQVARDYLSLTLDIPVDSFSLKIEYPDD
jgi:hypothetical protein